MSQKVPVDIRSGQVRLFFCEKVLADFKMVVWSRVSFAVGNSFLTFEYVVVVVVVIVGKRCLSMVSFIVFIELLFHSIGEKRFERRKAGGLSLFISSYQRVGKPTSCCCCISLFVVHVKTFLGDLKMAVFLFSRRRVTKPTLGAIGRWRLPSHSGCGRTLWALLSGIRFLWWYHWKRRGKRLGVFIKAEDLLRLSIKVSTNSTFDCRSQLWEEG